MYRIWITTRNRIHHDALTAIPLTASAAAASVAALLYWWIDKDGVNHNCNDCIDADGDDMHSSWQQKRDCNASRTMRIPRDETTTTTTTATASAFPSLLFSSSRSLPLSMVSSSSCESRTRLERGLHNDVDNTDEENLLPTHYALSNKRLGEGAYAKVQLAVDKKTGEQVAVKSISRAYTDRDSFQREMRAMQYVLQFGGHPHIVSLHTYFEDDDFFHVVMDYISGGEMFDHLIKNGAYSEADAARLVREVASALAFLHGIGVVHADLKPENLMLSSEQASDSIVKLVDFGCTQIPGGDNQSTAFTPAYAPPETFQKKEASEPFEPPMDMWALGVILYIMLVGLHPFVLTGNPTDEELETRIKSGVPPPIRESPMTAHLSTSAKELLERLIEPDASKRMTAEEMLDHPWVNGTTAPTAAITGSDERLRRIRAMKTRLQANFLQDVVNWSDNENHTRRQTSLIDESFKTMYAKNGGFLPLLPHTDGETHVDTDHDESISMAEFRSLLAENMKHKFFPKNHIVYNEGDIGNHMYIINSGTIEVTTSNGSRAERSQGDFFGEGALLHPKSIRSGTIRCKTPVHVIEISREYFQKYLQSSELGLMLAVKEKDRIRRRNRAKMILTLQNNPIQTFKKGDVLYNQGMSGDTLFIVDSGDVKVTVQGEHVFTASKGNICGEQSVITGLKRNCTARCESDSCVCQVMAGREYRRLMDLNPDAKASLRELCLRRDLKKAIVHRMKKEFPYNNPMEAFLAVGVDANGLLGVDSITKIMRDMDPEYTDNEIAELFNIMDLTNSGTVSFEEFRKVFVADLRTSASI
jgi:serine/threonine protein kinase